MASVVSFILLPCHQILLFSVPSLEAPLQCNFCVENIQRSISQCLGGFAKFRQGGGGGGGEGSKYLVITGDALFCVIVVTDICVWLPYCTEAVCN